MVGLPRKSRHAMTKTPSTARPTSATRARWVKWMWTAASPEGMMLPLQSGHPWHARLAPSPTTSEPESMTT